MELFSLVVSLIAIVYFIDQWKRRKNVAHVVHIQERTEEAEVLDFTVTLFEGETQGQWLEKMNRAYEIAEGRRSFNYDRMMKLSQEAKENAMAEKAKLEEEAKNKKSAISLAK